MQWRTKDGESVIQVSRPPDAEFSDTQHHGFKNPRLLSSFVTLNHVFQTYKFATFYGRSMPRSYHKTKN